MHDRNFVHLDETLRFGWPISKSDARPQGVVVFPRVSDDETCLLDRVEGFAVELLAQEAGVEALALPGIQKAARLNFCYSRALGVGAVREFPGNELAAIRIIFPKCHVSSVMACTVDHFGCGLAIFES